MKNAPPLLGTYLKLLLVAAIWGGTFVAGRVLAAPHQPEVVALLRFSLAAASLFVLLKMRGYSRLFSYKRMLYGLVLGAFGAFAFNILFLRALDSITAGRAAILVALNPVLTELLGWIFFKERIGILRAAGMLLALLGVAYVLAEGDLRRISTHIGHGDILMLIAVVCWTIATLFGKPILAQPQAGSALEVTFTSLVCSTLLFLITSIPHLNAIPHIVGNGHYLIALLYLAFAATSLAYVWYYDSLQRIGAARAAIVMNLEPIFGVTFGGLWLGEKIDQSIYLGAIAVVVGIFLTTLGDNHVTFVSEASA